VPDGDQKSAPQTYRLTGIPGRTMAQKDAFDALGYAYLPATLTAVGSPAGSAGAVASNAFDPEDEYQKLYVGGVNAKAILAPPYFPRRLDRLSQENNTLSPCIEAMVTNIDDTGFIFEKQDSESLQEDVTDQNVIALNNFFAEPWPGETFRSIRKKVRRDRQRTGNGYMEVIRNPQGKIVFLRHVDAKMMRIVKLDNPTVTTKTVMRGGVEVSIKMQVREHRYVQLLNGLQLMYFKQFGSERDLDKTTGFWSEKGQRLPANKRASEILHFTDLPDAHTPYGVPCWIGQMPSVVGSRKAEEFNVEFFDNGGVPPLLILLQGGVLTKETRVALEQMLHQGASKANRTQILEAEPVGGSIEQSSTARITVERFGHDRQTDAMFEKYDDKCELRVRRGFRIPPIFIGQANDASFATAYASYVVAEAQVFKPAREEFDEFISLNLLPEMGYRGYRMRSLPMQINDSAKQLQAIELAGKTDRVDPGELVHNINETMGLHMKVSPTPVIGFGEAITTLTLSQPGVQTNPLPEPSAQTVTTSRSTTSNKPTPSQPPATGNPSPGGKQNAIKKVDYDEPMIEVTADKLAAD
jgi:PBSX family phage portal protein